MEKRLLLFLVLTFLLIFVYYSFVVPPAPVKKPGETPAKETPAKTGEEKPAKPPAGAGESAEGETPAGETPAGETPAGETPAGETPEPAAEEPAGPAVVPMGDAKLTSPEFENGLVRWRVDPRGGSIAAARLKEFAQKPDQDLGDPANWYPVLTPALGPLPGTDGKKEAALRSLTLDVIDGDGDVLFDLTNVDWGVVEVGKDRVVFGVRIPKAGIEIAKELTFPADVEELSGGAYHAGMALRLKVVDAEKAAKFGADGWRIRLTGPGRLPHEAESYGGSGNVAAVLTHDVVDPEELHGPEKTDGSPEVWPKPEDQGEKRLVDWAGVHSRFFASILKPVHPTRVDARQALVRQTGSKEEPNVTVAIDFTIPLPKGGETEERSFLLYAGPMDPDVFDAAPYAAFAAIVDYGFFGFVAKPLVFLLGLLESIFGNWGIAIILLTLLIRMAMFPLSRKGQLAMQRYQKQMARLKPKMDALKEKYGADKRKMNEQMMKLYREEGVRMFPSGCLVMFLQFPIFIGLFQALRYSIGLRHSSFLWVRDLTAPDQLMKIDATNSIPVVPEYLNVLPILMAVTWWLSTKLSPKPADPQQQQTMKMMQWMPIIFSVMLYSYPAGLALYMVVSSTWSIFETRIVRKLLSKEDEGALQPAMTFRKGR